MSCRRSSSNSSNYIIRYNNQNIRRNRYRYMIGGREIQDAPVSLWESTKCKFPCNSHLTRGPYRFHTSSALAKPSYYFFNYLNSSELPILRPLNMAEYLKRPLGAGHISQSLTSWNPNNWPMIRHLRLTKHTYSGRGAYIFQLDHRILC